MQIEIPKKERAKSLYDAGHRTPTAIARGARVCERTARRYIQISKKGNLMNGNLIQRKNTKRTSKLEAKVIRKARDRRRI